MGAEIISKNDKSIEIKLKIEFTGSMLESEELIQKELNKVGQLASNELLKNFDTDGENISKGGVNFYSKGHQKKTSEHPTEQ